MQRTMTVGAAALALAALAAPSGASFAQTASAQSPSPVGIWQQVDDDSGVIQSHIAIAERGGTYEGTILRIFPGPGDPPNPVCNLCKGAKKGAPIVGFKVLENLRKSGESYEGGIITDPESGTEYSARMSLSADGKVLTVRGFVGVSLLGRSQEWKRLK